MIRFCGASCTWNVCTPVALLIRFCAVTRTSYTPTERGTILVASGRITCVFMRYFRFEMCMRRWPVGTFWVGVPSFSSHGWMAEKSRDVSHSLCVQRDSIAEVKGHRSWVTRANSDEIKHVLVCIDFITEGLERESGYTRSKKWFLEWRIRLCHFEGEPITVTTYLPANLHPDLVAERTDTNKHENNNKKRDTCKRLLIK